MESRFTQEEALKAINRLLDEKGYGEAAAEYIFDGDTAYGVHIKSSQTVRSRADRMDICRILERTEGVNRTAGNLSAEWAGHNAVYRIIRSPAVGDADLEFDGDKRGVIRFFTGIMDRLGIR